MPREYRVGAGVGLAPFSNDFCGGMMASGICYRSPSGRSLIESTLIELEQARPIDRTAQCAGGRFTPVRGNTGTGAQRDEHCWHPSGPSMTHSVASVAVDRVTEWQTTVRDHNGDKDRESDGICMPRSSARPRDHTKPFARTTSTKGEIIAGGRNHNLRDVTIPEERTCEHYRARPLSLPAEVAG